MTRSFDYATFTTRNIGFVSEAEQARLQRARVLVAGTGGMGGAALMAIVRAGIGHLTIADIDNFDISNLNRQVFAFTDTVGRPKAEATAELIAKINPLAEVEVLGREWTGEIGRIAASADVIINGTDDLAASLLIYRTARAAGVPVIDAYASPLPSVYVTRPGAPMPEERLGYPTIGKAWDAVTPEDRGIAFQREAEYVLLNSSSRHHIDLALAGEVAAGKRSRMSFAPMVISTGMLMAYETIALVLDRKTGTDHRGWFLNTAKPAVERPMPAIVAWALRPLVRRALARMMEG